MLTIQGSPRTTCDGLSRREVLRAGGGLLLAEGETHHIVMNSQGRARAFPPKYAEMMKNGNVTADKQRNRSRNE